MSFLAKVTEGLERRRGRSRLLDFAFTQLNAGDLRSIKAKKNILGEVFARGASILISLTLVPLTINYVDVTRYGIWLTISSIIGWFVFFDIGLTDGLRNKFAEAVARGQNDLAQTYVSTVYTILALIFSAVWLLFLVVNPYLDWTLILNVPAGMRADVTTLAVIVFTYFCMLFVLQVITTILTANQEPAKASLVNLSGQLLSLILVVVLVKTTEGSLVKLGIALCLAPILVFLAANFVVFSQENYRDYRPSWSKVDFSKARELFGLGVKFFVISIAFIIQYQTANIIIAQHFGGAEVTAYNIVHKYFGMPQMLFLIFLTPFWSASTEAFVKGDLEWIKASIKKYTFLYLLLVVGGGLMLILANPMYDLWLGKDTIDIDFIISVWGFLYFAANMFSLKYVYLLNGISALRIQFLSSLVSPVVFLVTALVLIRYFEMGVAALFIAGIIANFNGCILAPIQYYQIIHRQKAGIWIR